MKIKKGDEVKVLKGKDKGKTGKVERVFAKEGMVVVLGINEYKRHIKARSEREKSEIKTITKPLSVSNVILICPKCHKPTKIGMTVSAKGKKRVCKKCKKEIS